MEVGGLNRTVAVVSDAVAATLVGEPGTVRGVASTTGDQMLVPITLRAATRKW